MPSRTAIAIRWCELVRPDQFVDITGVIDQKTAMLECHRSQQEWLDATQQCRRSSPSSR